MTTQPPYGQPYPDPHQPFRHAGPGYPGQQQFTQPLPPVPPAGEARGPQNPDGRSWWQKKRFLLPIVGIVGLAIGASGSSPDDAAAGASPGATVTVTATATETVTAKPVVVTKTVKAAVKAGPGSSAGAGGGTTSRGFVDTRATAKPKPKPKPKPKRTASSAYYANCSEARAAGVTPLHPGEPGYRSGLDRDGDGSACE